MLRVMQSFFTEAILTARFQLGFHASRQRLKDFVTPVADVDHVEIFRGSTSGWIRVTGFENFCAAFRMSFLGSAIPATYLRQTTDLSAIFFGFALQNASTVASSWSELSLPATAMPRMPSRSAACIGRERSPLSRRPIRPQPRPSPPATAPTWAPRRRTACRSMPTRMVPRPRPRALPTMP